MTKAVEKPTTPPLFPYAVRIHDNSMFPALEPGDVALANPDAPVKDGQNVVLWIGGETFLKRLMSRDAHEVRCMQLNPQREFVYGASEVQAVHAVFGWHREG
jgi:phage repressor protein C with HTH and peptisase S24 domain